MEPLVADMVQADPMKRPTMDEVVTRVSEIRGKLSAWKLRLWITREYELGHSLVGGQLDTSIGPSATSLVLRHGRARLAFAMNGVSNTLEISFMTVCAITLGFVVASRTDKTSTASYQGSRAIARVRATP